MSSLLNIRLVTEPERVDNSSALHGRHEEGEKNTACALVSDVCAEVVLENLPYFGHSMFNRI